MNIPNLNSFMLRRLTMNKNIRFDFAITGGDERTAYMAILLAKKGFNVICYETAQQFSSEKITYTNSLKKAVSSAPTIISGIPLIRNNVLETKNKEHQISADELLSLLCPKQYFFGGVIPDSFLKSCDVKGIKCIDYMKDEVLTIHNAVYTAEGAIAEVILHSPKALHGSQTLILGYGRCGKVLADKLKGLSAEVTVCSNSQIELAYADSLGLSTLSLSDLSDNIRQFTYIFNTIPACILNSTYLKLLDKNTIIIDIASNKCGADYETAKLLNTNLYYCPGLPGKYAYESCANDLVNYTLRILNNESCTLHAAMSDTLSC